MAANLTPLACCIAVDGSELQRELAELSRADLAFLYCCAGCDANRMVEMTELHRPDGGFVFVLRLKRKELGNAAGKR